MSQNSDTIPPNDQEQPLTIDENNSNTCEKVSTIELLKNEGNVYYSKSEYNFALNNYINALDICDDSMTHEKAVLNANIGMVYSQMEDLNSAINHTTKAIELEPQYLKAILRRAKWYELKEDFESAIKDHEMALQIDENLEESRQKIPILKNKQAEKIEKMKNEMISSLKNLANPILNKFGLSTDNFKFEKNPQSGGYSIKLEK